MAAGLRLKLGLRGLLHSTARQNHTPPTPRFTCLDAVPSAPRPRCVPSSHHCLPVPPPSRPGDCTHARICCYALPTWPSSLSLRDFLLSAPCHRSGLSGAPGAEVLSQCRIRQVQKQRGGVSDPKATALAIQIPRQLLFISATYGDGRYRGVICLKTRWHSTSSESQPPAGRSARIWTVPNMICIARIAVTPAICYWVASGAHEIAFYAFVAAGVSDALDGWIARNFQGQKSVLGSYLDPLSDKLLINGICISCWVGGLLPQWLVGIFMFRDVGLVGLSYMIAQRETSKMGQDLFKGTMSMDSPLEIKASNLSKANSFLQLILLSSVLGSAAFPSLPMGTVIPPLMYLSATTTVASMVDYIVNPGYNHSPKSS